MICPECGGKLRDSAKFCPWCGEKIAPKPPPPELAVEFDKADDLFVVSEQPVHAIINEPESRSPAAQEISSRSIRFPVRYVCTIIILAFLAVLGILSIYFVPNHIIPLMHYKNAEKLFQAGDYEAAEAEFLNLGDYSDSRDYMMKCQYASAVQIMGSGSFAEAAKAFAALDGYADSDDLAVECLIRSAEIYLENGNYNAAISAYYAAGKPELAEDTARSRAEDFAEAGDYFSAAEAAKKYSEESAMEYTYLGSEKAMNEGDFITAAEGFESLGEYKNSRELLQECMYSFYSSEYRINGVSGETVRGFYQLGNYRNSSEMYVQTAYEYGLKMFESGNYYEAASMFRNTGTYEDSVSMLYSSRYELGKSLEDSDPASAYSIFSMLGNYSDSSSRKRAASAKLGENSSVWYADGFTSADGFCASDFRKSDTLLINCTAGTDSPSGTVTLVITFKDSGNLTVSADCENIRNSSSFSASVPLSSAASGNAEITVSVKDSGEMIRRFEITISE